MTALRALLAWLAVWCLAAGTAAQGPPPADADVWPEHALPDDEAARQGRAAMPFTQAQIEMLGRLLQQTLRATEGGGRESPRGRIRSLRVASPGEGAIPAIAVRRGYTTAVSFTDATGAPWPIEEVLVDGAFLPEGRDGGDGASAHLLYLAPQRPWMEGNAVVKLAALAQPVVLALGEGGAEADFRVDVRLGLAGPNADPTALARPEGFHAGDSLLLGLLTGTIPDRAVRLRVAGGGPDARAWRLGDEVLLLVRGHLLSPGPWAAERDAAGRWVYRLPATPAALVSVEGREMRLGFAEPAAAAGALPAGEWSGVEDGE